MTVHEDLFAKLNAGETKFAPQEPNEVDSVYFDRLIKSLSTIPDGYWNVLQKDSQLWYNTAAASANEMKPVQPPAGFQSAYVTPAVVEKPKAATVTTSEPSEKKPGNPRSGVMDHARRITIKHFVANDWDFKDKELYLKLVEQMKAEGVENPNLNSCWTVIEEIKHVSKAIDALGLALVPKTVSVAQTAGV